MPPRYGDACTTDFGLSCRTNLKAFAALVAAAEREACAQMVEEHAKNIHGYDKHFYAYAIRARGEG